MKQSQGKVLYWALSLALAGATLAPSTAAADPIPQGWKAFNMQPVGYSHMDGKPPFKLAIKQAGSGTSTRDISGTTAGASST